MTLRQFLLPDAGEGLTEADILTWHVRPGDVVEVNQILVEIETAKAAVELPSPFAGVVRELNAAEGDTVEVGRPIITIEVSAGADEPAVREPMLVGYGPKAAEAPRRRRRLTPVAAVIVPAQPETVAAPSVDRVLAKPPVRKLAKALGIDLAQVAATGPNGSVSHADLEGFTAPTRDRETRVPLRGIRKHTAAAMVASAFTAPHVTEFLTVDVSATMKLRKRVAARPEFADVKVSPLLFVARAALLAVRRTPEINSVWDEAAGEIVLKHYVNLGLAAATERGLIVPNIPDAEQLTLLELARAIGELTATARAGKTTPAQLREGTLSITNVGVFGIDSGTPIINPGESAILCVGAIARRPWVVRGQIVPRWVTTLSVSFDHRVIDGQQGAQFLADVGAILTDPGLALL